jgi:hypothetical protein
VVYLAFVGLGGMLWSACPRQWRREVWENFWVIAILSHFVSFCCFGSMLGYYLMQPSSFSNL